MSQFYTDPSRENALPDAEVFELTQAEIDATPIEDRDDLGKPGFYWWSCFPGCLPDGEPIGPFETEEEAVKDARAASSATLGDAP